MKTEGIKEVKKLPGHTGRFSSEDTEALKSRPKD